MSGPMRPKELLAMKRSQIPEAVFDAFNKLIASNWDGCKAIILKSEAVDALTKALGVENSEIYRLGYLEIDDLYRREGWLVEYDKPAYNENYQASWTFQMESTR